MKVAKKLDREQKELAKKAKKKANEEAAQGRKDDKKADAILAEATELNEYFIRKVADDGNCWLYAALDQICGHHQTRTTRGVPLPHEILREGICAHFRNNEQHFDGLLFIEDGKGVEQAASVEVYTKHMALDKEWGGPTEFSAIAQMFNTNISIRISADEVILIKPYDVQGPPQGTMRLVHRQGRRGHYNSVRRLECDQYPKGDRNSGRPRDMGPIPDLKDSQLAALCAVHNPRVPPS
jgi:hypothetical protein